MIAAALEELDTDWPEDAIATIVALSIARYVFTADDLAADLRKPPHPNQTGAAFKAAYQQGLIEPVGYQPSTTRSRNSGVIRQWRRKVNEGVAA